jgi:hypothetical protein
MARQCTPYTARATRPLQSDCVHDHHQPLTGTCIVQSHEPVPMPHSCPPSSLISPPVCMQCAPALYRTGRGNSHSRSTSSRNRAGMTPLFTADTSTVIHIKTLCATCATHSWHGWCRGSHSAADGQLTAQCNIQGTRASTLVGQHLQQQHTAQNVQIFLAVA